MELLSGRTLREALDVKGPLPVREVTRVGLCLLDALQAIHRAGVVHRDVKAGQCVPLRRRRGGHHRFRPRVPRRTSPSPQVAGSSAVRRMSRRSRPTEARSGRPPTCFARIHPVCGGRGPAAVQQGVRFRHPCGRARGHAGTLPARRSAASSHRRPARQGSRAPTERRSGPRRPRGRPFAGRSSIEAVQSQSMDSQERRRSRRSKRGGPSTPMCVNHIERWRSVDPATTSRVAATNALSWPGWQ